MTGLVTYEADDSIATLRMDDGKVNALSSEMLAALNDALDRAEADRVTVVVLTGRSGVFSAGFDLTALASGGTGALAMVRGGFELAERLLAFPRPTVIACTGHAIAMGAFLLLSGDYRIGADGPYKITANEVAIGLTLPRAAIEICRQRLTPPAFTRAALLADVYSPEEAVRAGFLDRFVATELDDAVRDVATRLTTLDADAHAASKARARGQMLQRLRAAIEADDAELRATA